MYQVPTVLPALTHVAILPCRMETKSADRLRQRKKKYRIRRSKSVRAGNLHLIKKEFCSMWQPSNYTKATVQYSREYKYRYLYQFLREEVLGTYSASSLESRIVLFHELG